MWHCVPQQPQPEAPLVALTPCDPNMATASKPGNNSFDIIVLDLSFASKSRLWNWRHTNPIRPT
jgi:hypothetical protein